MAIFDRSWYRNLLDAQVNDSRSEGLAKGLFGRGLERQMRMEAPHFQVFPGGFQEGTGDLVGRFAKQPGHGLEGLRRGSATREIQGVSGGGGKYASANRPAGFSLVEGCLQKYQPGYPQGSFQFGFDPEETSS